MKRFVVGAVVGALFGLAAGFVVAIFVYPYIFLADIVATDQAPAVDQDQILGTGRFVHVNPADPIHYGMGSVTAYRHTIHLGPDFEVGPGPKFHVYLVAKNQVTSAGDVTGSRFVDLGRLRAFKGSQNYPVPPDIDPTGYGSVVIWCEAFGVLISPATLTYRTALTPD